MKTLLLILGGAYILRRLMRKNPTEYHPTGLLVLESLVVNFDIKDKEGKIYCEEKYDVGKPEVYYVDLKSLDTYIRKVFEMTNAVVSIVRNGETKNYYSYEELNPFDYFSTPTDLQIQPTLPGGDKRRKL